MYYSDVYVENMRRFVMKGSKFDPMRAQSACVTGTARRPKSMRRPRTAFGGQFVTKQNGKLSDDEKENNGDSNNRENSKDNEQGMYVLCSICVLVQANDKTIKLFQISIIAITPSNGSS